MYQSFKKLIIKLIPKELLYRVEPFLRAVLYQLFRGNNYQCNICNKKLRTFISIKDDKMCPRCGSISRNRRLWNILDNGLIRENIKILDFSPSRCIYRKFKKIKSVNYSGTDISGDFIADYKYDITNISCIDNYFDLIICYHILEHIEDDRQAMKELYRILKPGGIALIQTPFKEGDIYEDYSITTPEDRTKYFGQPDHVRVYSVTGLKERLVNAGLSVEIKELNEIHGNFYGLNEREVIHICSK